MSVTASESEKVWQSCTTVVTRKIAEETILVPISGDLANMQRIFSVNEVGAAVWSLMDGKRSVKSIKQAVMNEFEVAEDQLDCDLSEFIENLRQFNLVSETPSDAV